MDNVSGIKKKSIYINLSWVHYLPLLLKFKKKDNFIKDIQVWEENEHMQKYTSFKLCMTDWGRPRHIIERIYGSVHK